MWEDGKKQIFSAGRGWDVWNQKHLHLNDSLKKIEVCLPSDFIPLKNHLQKIVNNIYASSVHSWTHFHHAMKEKDVHQFTLLGTGFISQAEHFLEGYQRLIALISTNKFSWRHIHLYLPYYIILFLFWCWWFGPRLSYAKYSVYPQAISPACAFSLFDMTVAFIYDNEAGD